MIIVVSRRKLAVSASPDLHATDRARIETMLVARNRATNDEKDRPKE